MERIKKTERDNKVVPEKDNHDNNFKRRRKKFSRKLSGVEINDQMLAAVENAFARFSNFLGVEMMQENYWKAKLGIS